MSLINKSFKRAFLAYLSLSFKAAILSVSIFGCKSGYRAEPIDPPSAAIEAAVQSTEGDPLFASTDHLPQDWWAIFQDDQLSEFIQTALTNNPTLQAAEARTMAAVFNAQRLRSVLYPSLFLGADISRQKLSETGVVPFNVKPPVTATPFPSMGGSKGIPVYFTQYETEFKLNYDFDIWGKNRNTWRAALSEVQSKLADEAFSRLQLSINVAKVYFQLQVDYKRQQIAQENVENMQGILDYYQRRVEANVDNGLSLNAAGLYLASAKQALIKIQGDIAVNEYQLKTYLAGKFDEEVGDINIAEQPLPQVPLPEDIPLHLISRRPDIVAQLWMIESAGKQIEVAQAGFYPDFNLVALFGFQTIHLHELFRWPSAFFNVDPAISLPIFDGGRLLANLRGSEVNYDLAIFKYNELVLNAAREVLDGIAVLRNNAQQRVEFAKAVVYQENLLHLNKLRVSGNLSSSIISLTSLENVYIARDQDVVALGNTVQAMLNLVKALGGGYDQRCDE